MFSKVYNINKIIARLSQSSENHLCKVGLLFLKFEKKLKFFKVLGGFRIVLSFLDKIFLDNFKNSFAQNTTKIKFKIYNSGETENWEN